MWSHSFGNHFYSSTSSFCVISYTHNWRRAFTFPVAVLPSIHPGRQHFFTNQPRQNASMAIYGNQMSSKLWMCHYVLLFSHRCDRCRLPPTALPTGRSVAHHLHTVRDMKPDALHEWDMQCVYNLLNDFANSQRGVGCCAWPNIRVSWRWPWFWLMPKTSRKQLG